MFEMDPYQLFLQVAPDAFFVHDGRGRILDVNEMACTSLGYTRDDLLGMNVLDIEQDFDRPQALALWARAQPGQISEFNGTHRRRDGTTFPVQIHAKALMHNGVACQFTLVRDISAQIDLQQQLQRQVRLYSALSEINQAIVRLTSEEELFPLVCRIAVEFGGMKLAWIGQFSPPDKLIPVHWYGSGQEYLAHLSLAIDPAVPEGRGPAATSWREQRSVIVNDYQAHSLTGPWREMAAQYGWRSSGTFPILRAGKSFATLGMYHDHPGAFDAAAIALMEEMTRDISFALEQFDHNKDRLQALDTVRRQKDFLNAILEAEPECVKVLGSDGTLTHMNPAGLAMLELDSLEQAQSLSLLDFVHPDYRDKFLQFYKNVTAGHRIILEFPVVGAKGTLRWLESHGTPLPDANGQGTALLAVTRDVTARKMAENLIWRQANYDLLTELPNRLMFYTLMRHEIRRAQRDAVSLGLLFIDLDQFKDINDTWGHQFGDQVLQEVARRLTGYVRQSDTVARLGGDEFTVILPQINDSLAVEKVAESILHGLAEPFLFPDKPPVYVAASIGITVFPQDASEVDALLSNADQAMYAAKDAGRNQYGFFTRQLQERAHRRSGLLAELRLALAEQQFCLHFQPQIHLVSGQVRKAEALLRWNHPQRGLVGPLDFIPLAEETGLIVDIGDWVFREAVRWAKRWSARCPDFQLALNVSAVQFKRRADLLENWGQYLEAEQLSGQHLVVEITESLLLESDPEIKRVLEGFRSQHIGLAVDDFGTGYSSLSYIHRFPLNYLKIDRSFVADLGLNPRHKALSNAIIVMGHELGFQVVAEGIETEVQRNILMAAGCDFGQGYFFSRPLDAEQFEQRYVLHHCC